MAKSKKKKNADFQKVKLKVGKKLSKGDNVTNLSFKTRQIQLTQTIRTGGAAVPVTKRNLSIQDLLRQCDHHSIGPRVNAISGIKELLVDNFEEFLVPSNVNGYGTIIKKLSSMLVDNESDVRHSVINLCKLMFSKLKSQSQKLSVDNLISGNLFSHIHAYLCCAMNHIHEDIRLDSLILFDALLETFPQSMIQQTGDLLKNLIGMISSPISIGSKANAVAQRLSMNPDSKLPVMKFRARVLLRIKLTLKAALLEVIAGDFSRSSSLKKGSAWHAFPDGQTDGAKQNTLLVAEERREKFGFIFRGTACDVEDYIIKASSLEEFTQLSIPVLLQCWREAKACGQNEHESNSGNVIPVDALEVMSLVVSVIDLLFSLCSSSLARSGTVLKKSQIIPVSFLSENYESTFDQDFMNQFPFSTLVAKVPKKRKLKGHEDNTPTESSLASLNLCICHIMSHFCTDDSVGTSRPWLSSLQQFVVKKYGTSPSPEHNRLLSRILRNFYHSPSMSVNFAPAFKAACSYYVKCKVKLPQKQELFRLFSFILKTQNRHLGGSGTKKVASHFSHTEKLREILRVFVKSLPSLLLQIPRNNNADLEWSKEILSCISSSLNGPLCIKDEMMAQFTDVLNSSTGLLCVEDERVQQQVLSLLAIGPVLNKLQLKEVLRAIRRPAAKPVLPHRKSCSLACQAITCISRGIRRNIPLSSQVEFSQMTQAQSDSLSVYLKFMFSLLLGMSREEMEKLVPVTNDELSTHAWKSVDYTLETDQWNRHLDIAAAVCQEIVNLQIPASPSDGYDHPFTFMSNIDQLWRQTLPKYRDIHIMAAFSLFKFIYFSSFEHTSEKPTAELYALASRVMACVLVNFYSANLIDGGSTKEVVEKMKTEMITCLLCATPILPEVIDSLSQRRDSVEDCKEEKQAVVKAIEFIMSDDQLRSRINSEKLLGTAIS